MKTYTLFTERLQGLTEVSDEVLNAYMSRISAFNPDAAYLLKKEIDIEAEGFEPEDLLIGWLKEHGVSMQEAVTGVLGKTDDFLTKLKDHRLKRATKLNYLYPVQKRQPKKGKMKFRLSDIMETAPAPVTEVPATEFPATEVPATEVPSGPFGFQG
jgi:hypothetical protein